MSRIRVLNTSIFLFAIFLLQETVVSRINFPINGFSLYLAALMVLLSLEDRNGALVLTAIGYLFSVNKESIGDFTDSPIVFIVFISLASALSLVLFLVIGGMLGQENGTFTHAISIIFANTLWSFLITPLFLPLIIKTRTALLSNRERA